MDVMENNMETLAELERLVPESTIKATKECPGCKVRSNNKVRICACGHVFYGLRVTHLLLLLHRH